jgi:hypothetical protein
VHKYDGFEERGTLKGKLRMNEGISERASNESSLRRTNPKVIRAKDDCSARTPVGSIIVVESECDEKGRQQSDHQRNTGNADPALSGRIDPVGREGQLSIGMKV